MNKKIYLVLVFLILAVSLSACKKNASSDKNSSTKQEKDQSEDGVSVIIKAEEGDKFSEKENAQSGSNELEEAWDEVELEISDFTSNGSQSSDNTEDSVSNDKEKEELPEYYPGAY